MIFIMIENYFLRIYLWPMLWDCEIYVVLLLFKFHNSSIVLLLALLLLKKAHFLCKSRAVKKTHKFTDLVVCFAEEKSVQLIELRVLNWGNIQKAHERKERGTRNCSRNTNGRNLCWTFQSWNWLQRLYRLKAQKMALRRRTWSEKGESLVKVLQEIVEKESHWIGLRREDETWVEN